MHEQGEGQRRRKVLIVGYHAAPGRGPEASAGWAFATAAARDHDVWLITRSIFAPTVQAAMADQPELAAHLHVEFVDLSDRLIRAYKRPRDLYWFYSGWQRAAGRRARELHSAVGFDVGHHVTFANDWLPAGITRVPGLPIVWGPVGGSSKVPLRKVGRWLGARGVVTELARTVGTGVPRRIWGDATARRAGLVIAQNSDVARRFSFARSVITEPNAALTKLDVTRAPTAGPEPDGAPSQKVAVFAGRLVGWKGTRLAIDTIAHERSAGWSLRIFGEGYDRAALERYADRRGVGERVSFLGHQPREQVLEAFASADAFLFPSLHDQAGWVAGEASALGCPVVCLPLGGPALLAHTNAFVASLDGDVVANLADALQRAGRQGGTPHDRWSIDRLPDLVHSWYEQVIHTPTQSTPAQVRVLEAFSVPRPTTNPYIVQLARALESHDQIDLQYFSYRRALLGRYEVFHVHWPELLMGGHTRRGRATRRLLTSALVARLAVTSTPVVRTWHNLERPSGLSRVDHLLLDRFDALTRHRITLNDASPVPPGSASSTILHGDYRVWYADQPRQQDQPGRLVYVGLIRRYKGVEHLVEQFQRARTPGLTLHVAGNPSTEEMAERLRELASDHPDIILQLEFLDDAQFVAAVTSGRAVILPYRHMHNSGTVLAALSLGRPVMVPDNEVNRALSAEVGPGWVHTYQGDLSADDLDRLAAAVADGLPREGPDLSRRSWGDAGEAHLQVFRSVLGGGR